MTLRVSIDPTKCAVTGQCWAIAPDIFRLGGDNVAEVTADSFEDSKLAEIEEAEFSCPVAAITFIQE
jgi:ferredoxin